MDVIKSTGAYAGLSFLLGLDRALKFSFSRFERRQFLPEIRNLFFGSSGNRVGGFGGS
jgi:hypothetical protein